jgi:uncharacterized SAM-binding protein YcdF (DUF218 family)
MKWRCTLAFGSLFFILLLLIATALIARVFMGFRGTATLPADCGLVFGAAVHRSDDPGPGIWRRTKAATELLRSGGVQRLVLSGGSAEEGQASEAAVMRDVALGFGADVDALFLEQSAHSTWENLVYARPLLSNCTSVVAISDAYHLARIRYLASAQGWGSLSTYPAADLPHGAFLVRSVGRESLALLYYMLVTGAPLR